MNLRRHLVDLVFSTTTTSRRIVRSHPDSITMATAIVIVAATLGPSQATTGCTGVQLRPAANLQNAVDAKPTGTTFCLADGNYTTRAALLLKDGDRFIGVY